MLKTKSQSIAPSVLKRIKKDVFYGAAYPQIRETYGHYQGCSVRNLRDAIKSVSSNWIDRVWDKPTVTRGAGGKITFGIDRVEHSYFEMATNSQYGLPEGYITYAVKCVLAEERGVSDDAVRLLVLGRSAFAQALSDERNKVWDSLSTAYKRKMVRAVRDAGRNRAKAMGRPFMLVPKVMYGRKDVVAQIAHFSDERITKSIFDQCKQVLEANMPADTLKIHDHGGLDDESALEVLEEALRIEKTRQLDPNDPTNFHRIKQLNGRLQGWRKLAIKLEKMQNRTDVIQG